MIHYAELDIIFVSDYYDMPLGGLCRHNGKIEKFEVDYDTCSATIVSLTPLQRIRALVNKKLFELCVGHHWSYDKKGNQKSYFHWRRPEFLHKMLFNFYYWIIK